MIASGIVSGKHVVEALLLATRHTVTRKNSQRSVMASMMCGYFDKGGKTNWQRNVTLEQ